MAVLKLEHISKTYPNSFKAVDDFNLAIENREFVILAGPSGCGKTTLLRIIAGLEDITEGTLSIDGVPVNAIPAKHRDIAMVFQNYALYPHMTVYQNMAFSMKMKRIPKLEIDKKIRATAQLLEIETLLSRKPATLSGGQRQRAAIGRAMVREPKIFLMDEPLSNLDAQLRTQLKAEISKLYQRLGTTFIYVTHDQNEAMTLGTKIVVLDKGKIQQADSPDRIYHQPRNIFTARFIGTPPMNLFNAHIIEQGNQLAAKPDRQGGLLEIPAQPAQRLKTGGYIGKTVQLGIRAEDLYLAKDGAGLTNAAIEAQVHYIERTGAESFVHAFAGGVPLTAKIPGSLSLQVNQAVVFGIRIQKLQYFDPVSQNAI